MQKTVKVSTDPAFVDKLRDIVRLYVNPLRMPSRELPREWMP